MKRLFLFFSYLVLYQSVKADSTAVITNVRDTTYCEKFTTKQIADTTWVQNPVVTVLRGIYSHPDQLVLGNAISENNFLSYCSGKGVNMINMYSRAFLYSESKRTILAAFVKKAKEQYSMKLITVDVRMTNPSELPGWKAYLAKYNNSISSIEPLTEFEPWVKNDAGIYDYPTFFSLCHTMGELCKQYGIKLNYYEGWIGNNYMTVPTIDAKTKYENITKTITDKIAARITVSSQEYSLQSSTRAEYNRLQAIDSQAAVDSMVKYCDRIFISNYVTLSDYNSTSTSLGAWDARMDKRCNAIAISDKRMNKKTEIIEIVSLEPVFLYSLYQCPGICKSFYGSAYDKAVTEYKKSTSDVLQYTSLIGRTIFYSKYAFQAQP